MARSIRPFTTFRLILEIIRSIPVVLLVAIKLRIMELRERKRMMENKKMNPVNPFEAEGDRTKDQDLSLGKGKASGTISQTGDVVDINPRVAGQLLNLPFKAAHVVWPAAEPLTPEELEVMAEPFADFLHDMGWEKLAKSSTVLFIHIGMAAYGRVRAVMVARAENAKSAPNTGHGKVGPREDVPSQEPDSGRRTEG
jgi:hypothetical protein